MLQIPETMWRVVKQQNPKLTVAVVYSWLWISYLAESDIVDYNFPGFENDSLCADAISFTLHSQITTGLDSSLCFPPPT